MIYINADHLSDGLYNIKNGKIYKYKAKGGTVRAYELRNIVTCRECKLGGTEDCPMDEIDDEYFCNFGEREGE